MGEESLLVMWQAVESFEIFEVDRARPHPMVSHPLPHASKVGSFMLLRTGVVWSCTMLHISVHMRKWRIRKISHTEVATVYGIRECCCPPKHSAVEYQVSSLECTIQIDERVNVYACASQTKNVVAAEATRKKRLKSTSKTSTITIKTTHTDV